MPGTLTPIETERRPERRPQRRTDEPDHGDHGNGRRPPPDKRTGGGGDNDGWNERPQGSRGPREKLKRYRLGVFFALAGDLMFFVAIVSAFFVSQASGRFDAYNNFINPWLPTAIPPVLWLNTGVLIISSVTAEIARRKMFHQFDVMEEWFGLGKPTSRRAMPWLAATAFLGLVFLAGQWLAWQQLNLQGVFMRSNVSSHFFFLITGVHGIHLVLGVGALVGALLSLRYSQQVENRQIIVDCSVWYWHSMGFFWIFLFVLLAFFQ
ncbi:cytochrome c oxidase subunit 3 [Granulicella aggregans]|uniref:cytochrome c oxidase subunit 3 n=1 Tax=Granulicella aggregans TaxID=474949 RepID=UPI0021DF8F72|nr:cytochrome c oxidase subunit 3 [Granulicella aggregans]